MIHQTGHKEMCDVMRTEAVFQGKEGEQAENK